MTLSLFGHGVVTVDSVNYELERRHYLGATSRGFAWRDEFGVMVLAPPTSRRLPADWLELTRWCLNGTPNGGSRQWSRVSTWLRENHTCTTVVSYSDPSAGHTGALYRACNWLWCPTWHRLVPPPSGGGSWDGIKRQAPKDRWVFHLRDDPRRNEILGLDETYRRRFPYAIYPTASWKRHKSNATNDD